MSDEMDLGLALMSPSTSSKTLNASSPVATPKKKASLPYNPAPHMRRQPSISLLSADSPAKPRAVTSPVKSAHVRRRSSLGDSIGPQNSGLRASQLVPVENALPPSAIQAFRRFALCFAIVEFDIDQGPEFIASYPPYDFTRVEQTSIAFTSLPDSAAAAFSAASGPSFSTFNWQIGKDSLRRKSAAHPSESGSSFYGYVNFMTQQDKALKRSYLQRSVVLVTHLPRLHGLFGKVAEMLSAVNLQTPDKFSVLLEVACNSIARWPDPKPGGLAELPFLDSLITVEMPLDNRSQIPSQTDQSPRIPRHAASLIDLLKEILPAENVSSPSQILAGQPLLPLSLVFRDHLSSLWTLWELVALSEPFIVFGPDVSAVSAGITWLTLMCLPIHNASNDTRPLLNIHMHDYTRFVNGSPPRKGTVIGSSNPLVFSSCRHWPHIIRLSTVSPVPKSSRSTSSGKPDAIFGLPPAGRSMSASGASQAPKGSYSFRHSQEHTSGVFSQHRRTIKKDHDVLKIAEDKVRQGDFVGADAHLIRHFSELSEKLLSPLNRFFSTLQPLANNPIEKPKSAQAFSPRDFLSKLSEKEIPLGFKRSNLSSKHATASHFYEKWLKSPAFATWLQNRVDASDEAAKSRFLEELARVNVQEFSETQSSTQVVDLLSKLDEASLGEPSQGDRAGRLRAQAQRLRELQDSSSEMSDSSTDDRR